LSRLIFDRSSGNGGGGPLARGVGAEDGLAYTDGLVDRDSFEDIKLEDVPNNDCVCRIDALDENDIISEAVFL
jgi:hypothetical protein